MLFLSNDYIHANSSKRQPKDTRVIAYKWNDPLNFMLKYIRKVDSRVDKIIMCTKCKDTPADVIDMDDPLMGDKTRCIPCKLGRKKIN